MDVITFPVNPQTTSGLLILLHGVTVGTQRAYFELKYFKIVKMRDAK